MFNHTIKQCSTIAFGLLLSVLFWTPSSMATTEIHGVYGMHSTGESAWLAIKIFIPEDQALSGVLWYNNDGNTIFPSVQIGTGHQNSPGLVSDFLAVATNVQGFSSGWSEVTFSEPIVASLGSLYLVFEFPVGDVLTNNGEGGGPGFGYQGPGEGCPGWLSGEGEIWARLHRDYSFAVQPSFVPFEEGMTIKSLSGDAKEIPELVTANYFEASPNPFNPATSFNFGLIKAGNVSIDVYDLKGRHVILLLDENLSSGHHSIGWRGQDGDGRGVSSGVYFVRLAGVGFVLKQKILLVR